MSLDRAVRPRATTPVDPLPSNALDDVPELYVSSPAEYESLLQRGATRQMCERYCLRYTRKRGIVAEADEELLDLFSTPILRSQIADVDEDDEEALNRCEWYIHLGRRIALDRDNDANGHDFVIALIEDTLIYPIRSEYSKCFAERWETVAVSPGKWVSRPIDKCGPGAAGEYERDEMSEGDESEAEQYGEHGPPLEDEHGRPNTVPRTWEALLVGRAEERALNPSFGRVHKPPVGHVWEYYEDYSGSEEEEGVEEVDPTRRDGSWTFDQSDEEFPQDYSESDNDTDEECKSDDSDSLFAESSAKETDEEEQGSDQGDGEEEEEDISVVEVDEDSEEDGVHSC